MTKYSKLSRLLTACCAATIAALAPANDAVAKFKVLVSLGGTGGAWPYDTLISDSSGYFYGTTSGDGQSGVGVVFKFSNGVETVLWSFEGGSDGANPYGNLIQDSAGNLYGTTTLGGGSGNCSNGCGTIFIVTPGGNEKVLHSFGGVDGQSPMGGLIKDATGNFYGTTLYGGANGDGTVFRLSPKGKLSVLWSFTGGSDGANPYAALLMDKNGNLYGTAYAGGNYNNGTVFELKQKNGSIVVLCTFDFSNGGGPSSPLIADKSGNFYGTTRYGGSDNDGTVFECARDGTLTTLHTFTGGNDGAGPQAGVFRDSKGNIYGTTYGGGGSDNRGTAYKLDPSGTETILHSFTNGTNDGGNPAGGLLKGTKGNVYGTTIGGGQNDAGTVYELSE